MAKETVHKWRLNGEVRVDETNFFQYACSRCRAATLNGQPLPAPFNKECRS